MDRLKRVTTKCLYFLPLLLSLRSGRWVSKTKLFCPCSSQRARLFKEVSWATPKRLRAGGLVLQGNRWACFYGWAIQKSQVPDVTVSHQRLRLPSWQFRLPMQEDLWCPLYNPAAANLVGFVHSLAALVSAPTQNTLFVEDPFAVRREFLSFLSWGFPDLLQFTRPSERWVYDSMITKSNSLVATHAWTVLGFSIDWMHVYTRVRTKLNIQDLHSIFKQRSVATCYGDSFSDILISKNICWSKTASNEQMRPKFRISEKVMQKNAPQSSTDTNIEPKNFAIFRDIDCSSAILSAFSRSACCSAVFLLAVAS